MITGSGMPIAQSRSPFIVVVLSGLNEGQNGVHQKLFRWFRSGSGGGLFHGRNP